VFARSCVVISTIFCVCASATLSATIVRSTDPESPTVRIGQPLTLKVEAPDCPAARERTMMRVSLEFIEFELGSAIVVSAQPSGRVIGTIAPFGIGDSARYNLIVPKDVPVCVDNSPRPLIVRLTLEPPGDVAVGPETKMHVLVRDISMASIPTAD
jgi:hypothetical protein